MENGTYSAVVSCKNCGWLGNAICKKGVRVYDTACPNCGLDGYLAADGRHWASATEVQRLGE